MPLNTIFKVTNAWIVQPQAFEKKLHASIISLNVAQKKQQKKLKTNKKMIIIFVNILLHILFFHNFSQV